MTGKVSETSRFDFFFLILKASLRHDFQFSTIMQLLASLGEDVWDGLVWPPYASMLLIEVSETISGFQSCHTIF